MSLLAEKGLKKRPERSIWAWTCFSCVVLVHWLISESIGWFVKDRSLWTVGGEGFGFGFGFRFRWLDLE